MTRRDKVSEELRYSYREGADGVDRKTRVLNVETLAEIKDELADMNFYLKKLLEALNDRTDRVPAGYSSYFSAQQTPDPYGPSSTCLEGHDDDT